MEFLQTLKLQKENEGTSTGTAFVKSKGDLILSFSPVDGNMIGGVSTTDKDAYEKVITTAQSAFLVWRNWHFVTKNKRLDNW